MGVFLSSESSVNSDAPAGRDWRWGVFGNLAFTVMLIASSASNVGFAMFDTSSNWLMTSLNPDPMMVSAVQVATTLPMFLLTLPAGALTDIIDARRMLIGAQLAVTAISIVFAAVVALHWATPAVLLATTFCLGGTGALAAPAWLVITPMLVPKHDLDSAIAINNASYNVSRARSARRLAGWRSRPSASPCRSGAFASAISPSSPRSCGGARRAGRGNRCPPSAL